MRRVVQLVAATALLAQVAAAFSGVCYLICLAGACSGGTAAADDSHTAQSSIARLRARVH
jgi:hypothetical protein